MSHGAILQIPTGCGTVRRRCGLIVQCGNAGIGFENLGLLVGIEVARTRGMKLVEPRLGSQVCWWVGIQERVQQTNRPASIANALANEPRCWVVVIVFVVVLAGGETVVLPLHLGEGIQKQDGRHGLRNHGQRPFFGRKHVDEMVQTRVETKFFNVLVH